MFGCYPKIGKRRKLKISGHFKASVFRHYQNQFLKRAFADVPVKTVLNTGSNPGASDKEGSTYEAYFPEADFYTLDRYDAPEANHFNADLMNLDNVNQTFDAVLIMSVLEHVDNPFLAVEKLKTITHSGSYLYITVPWMFPLHDGEYFDDFWRFTPKAIAALFPEADWEIIATDTFPSVIQKVRDRKTCWNAKGDTNGRTFTGLAAVIKRR